MGPYSGVRGQLGTCPHCGEASLYPIYKEESSIQCARGGDVTSTGRLYSTVQCKNCMIEMSFNKWMIWTEVCIIEEERALARKSTVPPL